MSFLTVLLLGLQIGYPSSPSTQPTQSADAPIPARPRVVARMSIDRVYDIPPVYSANYATQYLGIDSAPPIVNTYGSSVGYGYGTYPSYGYPYYGYAGFRRFFFAPAPFVRGNVFNPSPFFRSPGQPGQIAPRMRGGSRGGGRHR